MGLNEHPEGRHTDPREEDDRTGGAEVGKCHKENSFGSKLKETYFFI